MRNLALDTDGRYILQIHIQRIQLPVTTRKQIIVEIKVSSVVFLIISCLTYTALEINATYDLLQKRKV